MDGDTHKLFESTRWTLVGCIAAGGETGERAAEELARRYWPAVYAYFRRAGLDREAAAESTQAFYAETVIGRRLFERADPDRGRLRSLFLRCLKNFQIDEYRRYRNHATGFVDLAFDADSRIGVDARDPGEAFSREWAADQLNEAIARTRDYYFKRGKQAHWDLFEARHLTPLRSGTPPPPFCDLAADLGYESPASAAAATQQVRQRMLILLKAVVAETVTDLSEADCEYEQTLALLGRQPARATAR